MKLNAIAIALLGMAPALSFAELGDAGFSGDIAIVAGIESETSNFQTDDKIKNGNLNSDGESASSALVVPLGSLQYTFGERNNHQFVFGTTQDDIAVGEFAIELGYKTELEQGTVLAFSFMPSLMGGETWEDPYMTGERKETDISGSAFLFEAENIMGSDISTRLGFFSQEVDKELSGSDASLGLTPTEMKKMERDGSGFYTQLSYEMSAGDQAVFIPSVKYISFSADGDAMSFDEYGVEFTYQRKIERHAFSASVKYNIASYSESNPIFDDKQKDNKYGAFLAYEYEDFMDWKDWSLVSFAGYDNTSSNIDFYNSSEYLFGVGMNYAF